MVVEREPPKATPQTPRQPASSFVQHAPEFGKPSPLQNRLQPNNNVFNIPKPQQSRPEHHRPLADHKVLDPLMRQPPVPNPYTAYSDVIHIPPPSNPPIYNSYPKPPPTFSSVNGPTRPYGASYAYKYEQPVVDLTKPEPFGAPQPAFLDERFSANDPYTYIDAEKANENIKNLLEGAFDDEGDKPRTRGRKKKIEAAVEGLATKLHSLEVKAEDKEGEVQQVETEEDEEEEIDDGTVEGLKVKLLQHQVDGVEWMREKENGATKKSKVLPKGGILADDMGLGKTIQSIALLLTNPRPSPTPPTSATDRRALSNTIVKGTLVVAPLALIKQWEAEIKDKVSEDHRMRICVHHGPQRTKRFEDLKKYDVVITTYQILVSEHGSSSEREDGPKVGCFGLHWYRVILDEAHTIKNRNAKATQAAYNLRSEYRWCLTGTPMQNNLDELQSLIRFLRIKPYDNLAVWKDQITRPMSQGRGGVAIKRLQFYLKAFMKRRTKDVLKKEGALNPGGESDAKAGDATRGFRIMDRKVEAVVADFSAEERRFYDRLEKRTDESLERMMGDQKMNYASALVLLLRLRQACNHPQLVGGNMAKDKDAMTTGQASGDRSPSKVKSQDEDVDEMAALLGGLSVDTKQCDVCQKDLSEEESSSRMTRCAECEADFAGMGMSKKGSRKKFNSHSRSTDAKPASRKQRASKFILEDSDDERGDGEWIVPHEQHDVSNFGIAGGTDDENVEGGGESLLSNDTESGDESEIKILGSRRKEVISLDTSDEESEVKSESDSQSDSATASSSDEEEELPTNTKLSPTTSAKIRQLLTTLKLETPHHKTIVFSQFTSMLNLIEPHLRACHLAFTRYDGSMRNDLREASLTRLRSDPKCRILLCSLKCGSLGLNLTAASRVVILEPFWNPFVEEQAIDRVHRINQTKDVVVYKLTVKDTVEERILALQEKKRALASAAIEGKEKVGKLSMKDILNLFKRDAEHDGSHDAGHGVDGLGAKMRVLGASNGADVVRDVNAVRRVTPPVVGGVGGAKKGREDPVFGRRW